MSNLFVILLFLVFAYFMISLGLSWFGIPGAIIVGFLLFG